MDTIRKQSSSDTTLHARAQMMQMSMMMSGPTGGFISEEVKEAHCAALTAYNHAGPGAAVVVRVGAAGRVEKSEP